MANENNFDENGKLKVVAIGNKFDNSNTCSNSNVSTSKQKPFNSTAWYIIFMIIIIRDALEIWTSSENSLSSSSSTSSKDMVEKKFSVNKMIHMIEIDDNFNYGACIDLACCLIAVKGLHSRNGLYFWPVIASWTFLGAVNLISLTLCYNINKQYSKSDLQFHNNDPITSIQNRQIISYFEVELPKGNIFISSGNNFNNHEQYNLNSNDINNINNLSDSPLGKNNTNILSPIFIMISKFGFFVLHFTFAGLLFVQKKRLIRDRHGERLDEQLERLED